MGDSCRYLTLLHLTMQTKRAHRYWHALFFNSSFKYTLLNFRMWFKYGLKAQKLLAQGSALGMMAISKTPCKGKSFMFCLEF